MGSLNGRTQRNMWNETLKLKGWLSSQLFQEQFAAHYAEIIQALPLPEYMNPTSGLLNVAARMPQEIQKPDLGPCVYISYGCSEQFVQADSVIKLCYNSYDVVRLRHLQCALGSCFFFFSIMLKLPFSFGKCCKDTFTHTINCVKNGDCISCILSDSIESIL